MELGLIDAQGSARLDQVDVQIADLDGLVVGQDVGNTIYLDRDAAGYG